MRWDGFVEQGFLHLPRFASHDRLELALQVIEHDLAHHYDPSRQTEYDHRSYCPDLRQAPELPRCSRDRPIHALIGEALDWNALEPSDAQIAIRRAHNAEQPIDPVPHIDGIATAHNGVISEELKTFTALVGVVLRRSS